MKIEYKNSLVLQNTDSLRSEDGYYSWIAGKATSVYISALVYHALNSHSSEYQWILDSQNPDGSFGQGLLGTAAVLIWLEIPQAAELNAKNYLVSEQTSSGSWEENPYLTALCLEALLQNE